MATVSRYPMPLDRKKLLEDCDDETSFANRCLQVFVRETLVDIDGISAAFGRNDLLEVGRLAHRIKGASAAIRASFLREEAARLDVLGREGKRADAALCFSRLRAEFDNFKKFIAVLPGLPD